MGLRPSGRAARKVGAAAAKEAAVRPPAHNAMPRATSALAAQFHRSGLADEDVFEKMNEALKKSARTCEGLPFSMAKGKEDSYEETMQTILKQIIACPSGLYF